MFPPFTSFVIAAIATSCICGCSERSAFASRLADGAQRDSIGRAHEDSVRRHRPGYVVDSARTPEEELRRFRADIPAAPLQLEGGAASRDALVRKFARSLESNDTTALIRLLVNRAEFAFLIFPTSRYSRPPYLQPPGLVWSQYVKASTKGLIRLVRRMGGKPLHLAGLRCEREPDTEGQNRLWRECHPLRVVAPGDTVLDDLFGSIVERQGRYKFLSYANKF